MRQVRFSIIFIILGMSIAFISYDDVFSQTKLRNTPSPKEMNEEDIETLVKKCDFFDSELNQNGDCPNDFVDNGDGTITDRATGLMWEKEGSSKEIHYYSAEKYVKKLNKKKFAGHDDWRIPTIEELYSILEPNTNNKFHINPVFGTKPFHCWSADKSALPTLVVQKRTQYLTLDYTKGTFSNAHIGFQPGGSSASNFSSYIRAVRSMQ